MRWPDVQSRSGVAAWPPEQSALIARPHTTAYVAVYGLSWSVLVRIAPASPSPRSAEQPRGSTPFRSRRTGVDAWTELREARDASPLGRLSFSWAVCVPMFRSGGPCGSCL